MTYARRKYRGHVGGSVTCPTCGTTVGSQLALMSHQSSQPCKLAATERRMREEGWVVCSGPEAREVLFLSELEHEEAPAAYEPGGMKRMAQVPSGSTKNSFRQPFLQHAIWCPAWARPVVDESRLTITERARVIHYVMCSAERIAALQSLMSLGEIEALIAYSKNIMHAEAEESGVEADAPF